MILWGVLGYGNIANRFIKSLEYSTKGKLHAVASKTAEKRNRFRKQYPKLAIYSDYLELLQDPSITAVYIALGHRDHFYWAKQALLHNKAVLCEKPATLSHHDTKELVELAKTQNVFFMEAMKTRFLPCVKEIRSQLAEGILGDIQHIELSFCYKMDYDENSYIFQEQQGGALFDVGIYAAASILDYIKRPILSIKKRAETLFGIDIYDHVQLNFENEVSASFEVSILEEKAKHLYIYGSEGVLFADNFYRPQNAEIRLHSGEVITIDKPYEFVDFYSEIEEVHYCIETNQKESKYMSHQDSLDCIALIENIHRS